MGEFVRIKKDVRPYGGRLLEVATRHTYPNGRQVVRVYVVSGRGKASWIPDIREYNLHEVEAATPRA